MRFLDKQGMTSSREITVSTGMIAENEIPACTGIKMRKKYSVSVGKKELFLTLRNQKDQLMKHILFGSNE